MYITWIVFTWLHFPPISSELWYSKTEMQYEARKQDKRESQPHTSDPLGDWQNTGTGSMLSERRKRAYLAAKCTMFSLHFHRCERLTLNVKSTTPTPRNSNFSPRPYTVRAFIYLFPQQNFTQIFISVNLDVSTWTTFMELSKGCACRCIASRATFWSVSVMECWVSTHRPQLTMVRLTILLLYNGAKVICIK